jgi:two-component system sensor histidine kinase VanS
MLKQSEGLVTGLHRKINSNLSVKIFLGIFSVLAITFSLSFVIVAIALPTMYRNEFTEQFRELFAEFNKSFEMATEDELAILVTNFGVENNANIIIRDADERENILFQHISFNTENANRIFNPFSYGVTNIETGMNFEMNAYTHLDGVNQIMGIMGGLIPFVIGFCLLVSIIISAFYSRRLAKPIILLSRMSRKISRIDLSSRCDIRRTDEIGELGNDLNMMAEKLEKTLSELQIANSKLQEDIERERRQEKLRSDLFTAISHELKTPITILKGELGGMIDNIGVYKNRDEYLQHAFKTTEQMENLVSEILTVSRLETKEIQLALGKTDIGVVVNEVCQKHENLADSRSVAIVCYCEDELWTMADRLQIQNAISNIISNAIFHSPTGEIVNVQLEESEGLGVLTVENTGLINKADIENLFEPFYRGDKSRNRYIEGSGLGLYIVKRILEMHKFSFNIANKDDKVVFTMTFELEKE